MPAIPSHPSLKIFEPEAHALQLRAEKITWEKGKSRQIGLRLVLDPEISRERFVGAFLEPPLHNTEYGQGFGTIYTAAY